MTNLFVQLSTNILSLPELAVAGVISLFLISLSVTAPCLGKNIFKSQFLCGMMPWALLKHYQMHTHPMIIT